MIHLSLSQLFSISTLGFVFVIAEGVVRANPTELAREGVHSAEGVVEGSGQESAQGIGIAQHVGTIALRASRSATGDMGRSHTVCEFIILGTILCSALIDYVS